MKKTKANTTNDSEGLRQNLGGSTSVPTEGSASGPDNPLIELSTEELVSLEVGNPLLVISTMRDRWAEIHRRLKNGAADKQRLDWMEKTYATYPGEVLNVLTASGLRERIDAQRAHLEIS